VDELVAKQMMGRHILGLAVAVVQSGKVVKTQGYGYADLKRQSAATVSAEVKQNWLTCSNQLTVLGGM
jgi:hypothetical protein